MPTHFRYPDITPIIGRDVGLMIRAFAASLEDDDNLVRRGILELLTQSFKLDSPAFKQSHADDKQTLMKAASGVVLRKDLSLSRRLYSWLLGTAESSEDQVKYFRQNGLELLRDTLRVCHYLWKMSAVTKLVIFRLRCPLPPLAYQTLAHTRYSYPYSTNGRSGHL